MRRTFALLTVAAVLFAAPASAEAIRLKAALFTSDRTTNFYGVVKPFVEAVTAEAKGALEIDIHSSGVLGKDLTIQPQLVLDGTADFAFIVPGYAPNLFTENAAIELPGLFQSTREATLVYTHLIAAGALSGYDKFVVIGAYATGPETFHMRPPARSLADLKGLRVRANNQTEASALTKLGIKAVIMPINLAPEAIAAGRLDGSMLPILPLFEYGIGRITTNHYMLRTSVAPLAFVMSRGRFDGLPPQLQAIILKYSGTWAAERFIEAFEGTSKRLADQLRSDPDRTVTAPTAADQAVAQEAFGAVEAEWIAKAPRNAELLRAVRAEIAKVRLLQ